MSEDIGIRIQAASRSVSAPLALREALDRRPAERRSHPSRLGLASVGLTLAIIATMAGLLGPSGPSVQAVAAEALNPPEAPAPQHAYLSGFEAVGARTDTVRGRTAKTVIYARGRVRVYYTIVAGKPLDLPSGGRVRAGELSLARRRDGEISLLAWRANGKTCVLASTSLGTDELVALLRSTGRAPRAYVPGRARQG